MVHIKYYSSGGTSHTLFAPKVFEIAHIVLFLNYCLSVKNVLVVLPVALEQGRGV